MSHLPLGAINKISKGYITPRCANKDDEYICIECGRDVVFCKGEIVKPYFRHSNAHTDPCNYYENPNESQIHKDAKNLMKYLLEKQKSIAFIQKCICCSETIKLCIPVVDKNSEIIIESSFNYEEIQGIADIEYKDNNESVCMIEIFNTHKTSENRRPEPWFECDAHKFIEYINNLKDIEYIDELIIPCIRKIWCDDCIYKQNENNDKKNKAKDILYNWIIQNPTIFHKDFEIYPYKHWELDEDDKDYKLINRKAIEKNFDISESLKDSWGASLYEIDSNYNIFDLVLWKNTEWGGGSDLKVRWVINLINKQINYPTDFKIACDQKNISIYHIDIDWILSLYQAPKSLKFKWYFGEAHNSDLDNIYSPFVYIKIPFSKKDEIKSYGAKWDNDKKLWLLTYKKFNKNKYFIKQISSEIIYGCIIDILLKIKTN